MESDPPSILVIFSALLLFSAIAMLLMASSRGKKEASVVARSPGGVVGGTKTMYTLEEVAKHDKASDAWIIIDNKVYDVTSYVEEHPGGEAILKNAGGDATVGFHGYANPTRLVERSDALQPCLRWIRNCSVRLADSTCCRFVNKDLSIPLASTTSSKTSTLE